MSKAMRSWLVEQDQADPADVVTIHELLRLTDLANLQPEGFPELRDPPHVPVDHPRMAALDPGDTDAIFDEIRKGDILLQNSAIIRELYLANQAGVPIILNVRG